MYKKFIFFFLILLSCSSKNVIKVKKIEEIKSPSELYRVAVEEYEKGLLQNSVDILKKIETNYSYTTEAPRSILMISYIYYEGNRYVDSLKYLEKFKKIYPASKYISYAEFLVGICLYEQINIVSKDQSPSFLALKQFNKIIKNYPNTLYAEESKIRIDLINEQIAGHQMYVARYYINKGIWTPAIIKLQNVIEKYQNTIFVDEALHRMVEINHRIGNSKDAKKYAAILGYNYNSSNWYKKTYAIVGNKDYNIINKEKKISLKDRLFSIFRFDKND